MHHKYHTDGIILYARDVGERDRMFCILTRDLGTVFARAKGVRRPGAKLAPTLQTYTLGLFSFVRTGDVWKLTNAIEEVNIYFALRERREARDALFRVLELVRVLVKGEEVDPQLFEIIRRGIAHALQTDVSGRRAADLEILLVLRVLHTLGYLGSSPFFLYLISSPYITDPMLAEVERIRTRALREANRTLSSLPL